MRQRIVVALQITVFYCVAIAVFIGAIGLVIGLGDVIIALAKALNMNTGTGYLELLFILCAVVAGVGYTILLRLEK